MGDEVLDGWRWFMGHFDRYRQAHYSQAPAYTRFRADRRDGVLDWWSNAVPAHQRKVSGKNFCL